MGGATVKTRILRQGRSTTFVEADLYTEDSIKARSTLVFGSARDSVVRAQDFPLPDFPPEDSESVLEPTPLHPRFLHQFDIRAAERYQPFTGQGSGVIRWRVRLREESLRSDPIGLLCLADVPPPAVAPLMPGPAPVSSVTWQHDFLSDDLTTDEGWYHVESRAEAAGDGWSAQAMGIWSSDGRPIASGRQSVVVFA
jgi:acyl-CoA thioesterase